MLQSLNTEYEKERKRKKRFARSEASDTLCCVAFFKGRIDAIEASKSSLTWLLPGGVTL